MIYWFKDKDYFMGCALCQLLKRIIGCNIIQRMNLNEGIKPWIRPPTGSSSSSSSYLTKIKSQKALKNHNSLSLVDQKIQAQLLKEIQLTKELVEGYHIKLKKKKKEKAYSRLGSLIAMEEMIIGKDLQIVHLNKQIKDLKSAPTQIKEQTTKKYGPFDNTKLFRLADQVRMQRHQLQNLQMLHSKKITQLGRKKEILKEFQKKYIEICSKNGKKPLMYQQFKQQKIKKKEGQMKLKKSIKRVYHSIKQIVEKQPQNLISNQTPMTLKDVLAKKQIAQSALKVAKKKHINELNELNAKLQFLKNQNQMLVGKVREKEEELKAADIRFSESKGEKVKKKLTVQTHA